MLTKGSQRRLARFFLVYDGTMDAARSGSLPKSAIHATGKRSFRGNTPSAPARRACAARSARGHGGRSGGEVWAARYPKECALAAEGRATKLPQSPPAGRHLGSVGGSFPNAP